MLKLFLLYNDPCEETLEGFMSDNSIISILALIGSSAIVGVANAGETDSSSSEHVRDIETVSPGEIVAVDAVCPSGSVATAGGYRIVKGADSGSDLVSDYARLSCVRVIANKSFEMWGPKRESGWVTRILVEDNAGCGPVLLEVEAVCRGIEIKDASS